MADFICGYPPVVTIAGSATTWTITWAAGEWDPVLFASFTTSHYVGNTTQADSPLIIASNDGEQSDGTYDITITGDASAWVSGTDRCCPKIGSSLSHYTTLATCIAAMNGTTDRAIVWYVDTDKAVAWLENVGSGTSGYSLYGGLPDRLILFSGTSASFYAPSGDMTAVTSMTWDNFRLHARDNGYNGTFTAMTATWYIRRVDFSCGGYGVYHQGVDDKMEFHSCSFHGGYLEQLKTWRSMKALNCTFYDCDVEWVASWANGSTVINCVHIGCNVVAPLSSTITTSYSTNGDIGDTKSLALMETWNTESATGRPDIYSPATAGSDLLGVGTNCDAVNDTHGRPYVTDSYPIGASILLELTSTPDWPGLDNTRVGVVYGEGTGLWNPDGGICVPKPESHLVTDTTLTTIVAAPTSSAYTKQVTKISICNTGAATTGVAYVDRDGTRVDFMDDATAIPAGDSIFPVHARVPIILESTDVIKFQQAGTSAIDIDVAAVETT